MGPSVEGVELLKDSRTRRNGEQQGEIWTGVERVFLKRQDLDQTLEDG